ncbi:hypothetical protein HYH39_02265 [Clostridium botulinum]|nr:hypothetical protein KU40_06985 [Clostridium botulinum]MBY6778060.1 hypothetical protein [Clostridium botulinum]MBY6850952.1 hypothetical protein [Clostridium botulinum]NFF25019.1 hypothetical protein [Clostridium botulinum]NFF37833.1 hypothetical protein [Clostridium botulinum]
MALSIEICERHLDLWLEAELAVINGQSYSMGTRTLTRASLSEIRNTIDYWNKKLSEAKNIENNKGIARVRRVIPRDF